MASVRRFDVTRVRLRNYRSIASCDVRLGPLTLLVGPNGSGKSNFLDSLRLVSQSLDENLDNALRERGGVTEVRRLSTGHPRNFAIDLDYRGPDFAGSYGLEIAAVRGGDYRVMREVCRLRRDQFGEDDITFAVRDGELVASSVDAVMPPASEGRLYLVAAAGLDAFRPVFDGLSNINVYNLNPEEMRKLQKPDAGDLLRRDGSNVASVVEQMSRNAPDVKEKIEEYLRQIVPGVVSTNRSGLGAWETVEFKQTVAGSNQPWTFQATSMSDGTLRALGVLLALFSATDEGYSPIGIEEPEVALHPAAAGLLLEALQDASHVRQVLATSHSPDLLDSSTLTPENLLAVRSEDGASRIGTLDSASSEALRNSLYTAGELLRIDQLQPEMDGAEPARLFT